jgi:hypothetical protein
MRCNATGLISNDIIQGGKTASSDNKQHQHCGFKGRGLFIELLHRHSSISIGCFNDYVVICYE